MFKLIKYEFMKNRRGLLIMALIALGIFLLAPLGTLLESEGLMMAAWMLSFFYVYAAYLYVLVRGVSAYAGELDGRTGYMMLMVPRSAMSLLFSKLIFSAAFALVMMLLAGLGMAGAWSRVLAEIYGVDSFLRLVDALLRDLGSSVGEILGFFSATAAMALASVLSFVSAAYLGVTLSHWAARRGAGRMAMNIALFLILLALIAAINYLCFPELGVESSGNLYVSAAGVVCLNLGLSCALTALSALILEKRVSL